MAEREKRTSVDTMVKGHDLFQSLTVEEVDQITRFSSVRKYQKGETIFARGQGATHVFVLLEGVVDLWLPASHSEYHSEYSIVVSKIAQGEIFGLSSLLGSPRYTTAGRAVENTDLLAIEAKPFLEVLQNNCPMMVITFAVYGGFAAIKNIEAWRQRHLKTLHVVAGVILCGIGGAIVAGVI